MSFKGPAYHIHCPYILTCFVKGLMNYSDDHVISPCHARLSSKEFVSCIRVCGGYVQPCRFDPSRLRSNKWPWLVLLTSLILLDLVATPVRRAYQESSNSHMILEFLEMFLLFIHFCPESLQSTGITVSGIEWRDLSSQGHTSPSRSGGCSSFHWPPLGG